MPGSYIYSIGPLISDVEDGIGRFWRAPDGAVGMIDLAKNSDFATSIDSDRNLAFLWSESPLGGAYAQLNTSAGDLREINASGLMQDAWESVTAFRPNGEKLLDLLVDQMTTGADPLGDDACKPLTPTIRGELEIWLPGHSKVFTAKLSPAHPHWNKYVSQIQAELNAVRTQARGGKMIDPTTRAVNPNYHLKVADALMEKMRRMGVTDFEAIRPVGWPKSEKPVRHATVITDSFNGADSDTMGVDLTWTEISGDWDILSNRAVIGALSGAVRSVARADSDLSSTDMYAQCVVTALSNAGNFSNAGAICRMPGTSAETGYVYNLVRGSSTTEDRLYKVVSGTLTTIAALASQTLSLPDDIKVEANGSSVSGYLNSSVVRGPVTDTTITTNVRGGMTGYQFNAGGSGAVGDTAVDDFEAGDLAVAWHSRLSRNSRLLQGKL